MQWFNRDSKLAVECIYLHHTPFLIWGTQVIIKTGPLLGTCGRVHQWGGAQRALYLGDPQPVIRLLHGLPGVVHRLALVPLVPVRAET
jgi:hypothetical protein